MIGMFESMEVVEDGMGVDKPDNRCPAPALLCVDLEAGRGEPNQSMVKKSRVERG